MAAPQTDTIPKLDQVSYLFDTLGCVNDGFGFDAIREELIRLRPESTTHVKKVTRDTFWSNARDVLRELMRLGLVQRSALPSRPQQLDAHRTRMFTLTEEGEQFLALEKRDLWEFRYRFAQAMLIAHPYLYELHRISVSRELFFPRIQRSELPGDTESWRHAPPEPLSDACSWVATSVRDVLGIDVSADDLEDRMRPYLNAAWKRLDAKQKSLDSKQKSHVFSQAVVKSLNDVIVRVLLQVYGLRMDFVTFRSAVALLSDLSALWHTRSLVGRRGWTVWATSLVPPVLAVGGASPARQALEGPVWFTPRVSTDGTIKDQMIESFFALADRRGGFALIHVLRAEVCHRLRLHGRDFDAVLRKMHAQTLADPVYGINLDRGGGDEVPPSEEPFRIGNRAFYLITFLKR